MTQSGSDVSVAFHLGAEQALALCLAQRIQLAILKANSPSCGNQQIYDGTFQGKLKNGQGVTAQRLMAAGISVFNEFEIAAVIQWLAKHENSQPSSE